MNQFSQKLMNACVDVLVREISEQSIKYMLDKSKKYVVDTIEKGRIEHNNRLARRHEPRCQADR